MPRSIAAAMKTSLAVEDGVSLVWLLHFAFSGGDTRICTAATDIDWNGFTWQAVGGAISADGIAEDIDNETTGLKINLPAVDLAIAQKLLTENYIGRVVQVWRVHLDDTTGLVVADPISSFVGEMNDGWTIAIDRTARTARIEGSMTSTIMRTQDRPIIRRNLESHQDFFPGDLFYQFLPTLEGVATNFGGPRRIPTGTIIPQGRGA